MQIKSLIIILIISAGLLLIPFTAMQFSDEVNWSRMDFLLAGALLLGTGLMYEFIIKKIYKTEYRMVAGVILLAVLILVWTELAVGIFWNR